MILGLDLLSTGLYLLQNITHFLMKHTLSLSQNGAQKDLKKLQQNLKTPSDDTIITQVHYRKPTKYGNT